MKAARPADRPPTDAPLEGYAADVLGLVDLVPPGRATTYGDLAELVGTGGPRQAATVLARHGRVVAWWRVVRADGSLPAHLRDRAAEQWRAEGTPLRQSRGAPVVDLRRARWGGPEQDG